MRTIIVRYKTTAASAGDNEVLIRAVFDQLRAGAPPGLQYASYRADDGVTFVHVATLEADAPEANPLVALPAFKEFQRQLKERCAEPPVVTTLSPVGAYAARTP